MYNGIVTSVRKMGGKTSAFSIMEGLHQGSLLSPNLVALVMGVITRDFQDKVP